MKIPFVVSAVVLKVLPQGHLEGPSPTVSDSAGLDLGPRIYIYNMMVVALLVQDPQRPGTPGLVESSFSSVWRRKDIFSSTPLGF